MVYETALHGLFFFNTHGTITKGMSRATRSTTPLRFSLAWMEEVDWLQYSPSERNLFFFNFLDSVVVFLQG